MNDHYDEFAFLEETAKEWALPWSGAPSVERRDFEVGPNQRLSALFWRQPSPELVLLHGGGQNAHTWDTVALALGRPVVAFDLPGHGRSSWRPDHDYSPWKNAAALEVALPRLAPRAQAVVGMSLGGVTALRLAATRPDLVRKVIVIDVTPGILDSTRRMTRADRGAVSLIAGPPTYDTFDAMADAAIASSPNRSAQAVRRGVRHNSMRLPDGRWRWRYDLFGSAPSMDFAPLWDDVSRIVSPTMLIVGGDSKFVKDTDVAEMRRRLPALSVHIVPLAGHAVQSDRPLDLARLIEQFVFAES